VIEGFARGEWSVRRGIDEDPESDSSVFQDSVRKEALPALSSARRLKRGICDVVLDIIRLSPF
jgi:hypothetical protein